MLPILTPFGAPGALLVRFIYTPTCRGDIAIDRVSTPAGNSDVLPVDNAAASDLLVTRDGASRRGVPMSHVRSKLEWKTPLMGRKETAKDSHERCVRILMESVCRWSRASHLSARSLYPV